MIFRLLHITIVPPHTPVNPSTIAVRLNDLGRDWLQYASTSWILWTNKSTITVSEMLATHLDPADFLLVLPINPADQPTGRLAEWMWAWLNRPRDNLTGEVLTPLLPAPSATNYFDKDNPWLAALLSQIPPEDKSSG